MTRQKIKTDKKGRIRDRHRKQKELYNSVLLDRHPYFFRYVYKETDRAWKKYLDEANTIARQKFCMDLPVWNSFRKGPTNRNSFSLIFTVTAQ